MSITSGVSFILDVLTSFSNMIYNFLDFFNFWDFLTTLASGGVEYYEIVSYSLSALNYFVNISALFVLFGTLSTLFVVKMAIAIYKVANPVK